jgi:hypothetical protein
MTFLLCDPESAPAAIVSQLGACAAIEKKLHRLRVT